MKNSRNNILYYDAIAPEYNNMMENDSDRIAREKVANKFCSIVKSATVIDFGGGTGLDLTWLSNNNDTIFFCEPSEGMRDIAIANHTNSLHDNVVFLDDAAADFREWHVRPPFDVKVDAVLSNFAVLNCIPDIELLFQNLAVVVKPGGNVIALVLTKKLKKIVNGNFRNILKSFIHSGPATINVQYKKHQQTVYIYSIKEIIQVSKKHFDFCGSEVLPASGFTLIHLQRK